MIDTVTETGGFGAVACAGIGLHLQPAFGQGRCGSEADRIHIQPYGPTQAPERGDILNIGGFSDAVFNVVDS